MKKIQNKKAIIMTVIAIIIVVILCFIVKVCIDKIIIKNQMKTAIHAITIEEETRMYSSPKEKRKFKTLEIGSNIYLLNKKKDMHGRTWYKVKSEKKVGYILEENIGTYSENKEKLALMSDVSKFNLQNNFKTIGEFKAFLINNDIKYVYIRAGGRGYGKEGNFYKDPKFKEYADACEFLKIPFGIYFLDEALNSEEVNEEVEFFNNFISQNKYKYNVLPVALDIEKHIETGRADDIWDTRYILVNQLVEKLRNTGNRVIIYSNADLTNQYLYNVNAEFWLAYYPKINDIPDYWYSETEQDGAKNDILISKMVGWQFTQTGIESKVNENVDLSLVYSDFFTKGEMQDVYNDIKERRKIDHSQENQINNEENKLLKFFELF